jgi:pimeloyl-ACP methyl ester carboxylesterase
MKETAVLGNWLGWFQKHPAHPYARRQALVLINGLAEQAESWFRNAPYWRDHFDLHMPNLLVYDGAALHGRIDAGLPVSVDYLVEQLHRYLESFVQAPPYHLVAASLGGKVAVEYAVRYPEQVSRLVLLCPAGMGDEERLPIVEGVRRSDPRALIDSIFHNRRQADAGLFTYYQAKFSNRRWRTGFLRTVRGTTGHCVRQRLAAVTQPTLIISGAEDKIVSPQAAEQAARLLPQGHFLLVPQCGHAPQMEQAGLVNRVVLNFLSSPSPRPRARMNELLLARPNTIL